MLLLSILVVKDTFELKCSPLKCKYRSGNQACSQIGTVKDLHGIIRLLSFGLRNVPWELVFWLDVKKWEGLIIVLGAKLGEDRPSRMLLPGTKKLYLDRTILTPFYILRWPVELTAVIVITQTHPSITYVPFKEDFKNGFVVYKLIHIKAGAIFIYSACNYLMLSVLNIDKSRIQWITFK